MVLLRNLKLCAASVVNVSIVNVIHFALLNLLNWVKTGSFRQSLLESGLGAQGEAVQCNPAGYHGRAQ
jgi:hypothetical protein